MKNLLLSNVRRKWTDRVLNRITIPKWLQLRLFGHKGLHQSGMKTLAHWMLLLPAKSGFIELFMCLPSRSLSLIRYVCFYFVFDVAVVVRVRTSIRFLHVHVLRSMYILAFIGFVGCRYNVEWQWYDGEWTRHMAGMSNYMNNEKTAALWAIQSVYAALWKSLTLLRNLWWGTER